MTGAQLGGAAGAGAGEPGRGDDANELTYETVFGIYADDVHDECIVCGVDLNLNELPDINELLCPDCRERADKES